MDFLVTNDFSYFYSHAGELRAKRVKGLNTMAWCYFFYKGLGLKAWLKVGFEWL